MRHSSSAVAPEKPSTLIPHPASRIPHPSFPPPENAALKKRESALSAETKSLRGDNVKMYEKLKFLESYRPATAGAVHTLDVEASIDSMPNASR